MVKLVVVVRVVPKHGCFRAAQCFRDNSKRTEFVPGTSGRLVRSRMWFIHNLKLSHVL